MALGYVFLLLSLLSAAAVGIAFKLSTMRGCHPIAMNVTTFFWASAMLWGYTIFVKLLGQGVGLFPPFTIKAVFVAFACGSLASIGLIAFLKALRYGRIVTSWAILSLAGLLPAALSLLFLHEYREVTRWQPPVGAALIVASVFLFWREQGA